jgi:hypothetical protein
MTGAMHGRKQNILHHINSIGSPTCEIGADLRDVVTIAYLTILNNS